MKPARPATEVPPDKLRWRCDPRSLGFRSTRDLRPRDEIIGQPRAVSALELGLEIRSPGYNVFVVGLSGTGRSTTIRRLLEGRELPGETPPDLVYVHDFQHPEIPRAITLPAGRGRRLRHDMQTFVDELGRRLPEVYDSEEYQTRRRKLIDQLRERGRTLFKEFEQEAEQRGFRIVQVQMGSMSQPELLPVVASEPMSLDKLKDLAESGRFDPETYRRILKRHDELSQRLQALLLEGRSIERRLHAALRDLDREFAKRALRDPLQELRDAYADIPKVLEHLQAVEADILESLAQFMPAEEHAHGEEGMPRPEPELWRYEVNVVVDNEDTKGPPVIIETAPSWRNLFGSIELLPDRTGMWRADFTRIRAGSLLAANGGYLVFNVLDAMHEPAVWPTLKRMLRNGKAEIRTLDLFGGLAAGSLKPEPVDLDVKVVVIGDAESYQMLHAYDDEFRKIFKVKADFDSSMKRTRRTTRQYAHFVAHLVEREGLLPFASSGVAALLEAGVRLAGRRDRLSTRFSEIADVAREAHYWAVKRGARQVAAEDVERAQRERRHRVDMPEEHAQQQIDSGNVLLDVRGWRIGQVNALTIYDIGDHVFGRPARITSEVSMGRSGIINIEREANLSGSTHDKGVLLLAGYLRGKYAQHRPLTLSASLAFEQSYGGVDGDSASVAELVALISAIARLPLRQDLGVTGSINQKGEMQPIGAVNEKIEGFFDVCRSRGLTGTQGVVLPVQNVAELMLRPDVVEAVEAGTFHLYALRHVDQVLELMTGVKAGRRTPSGYEHDTVHDAVDAALAELAEEIKEYVDGSDTPSGRPPQQGLADDEEDEGVELRRRRRRRR